MFSVFVVYALKQYQVTAKGSSDVPVCWMFDAYLNLAKLIGQFSGSCLDITKGRALPNLFILFISGTYYAHGGRYLNMWVLARGQGWVVYRLEWNSVILASHYSDLLGLYWSLILHVRGTGTESINSRFVLKASIRRIQQYMKIRLMDSFLWFKSQAFYFNFILPFSK